MKHERPELGPRGVRVSNKHAQIRVEIVIA